MVKYIRRRLAETRKRHFAARYKAIVDRFAAWDYPVGNRANLDNALDESSWFRRYVGFCLLFSLDWSFREESGRYVFEATRQGVRLGPPFNRGVLKLQNQQPNMVRFRGASRWAVAQFVWDAMAFESDRFMDLPDASK